MEPKLKGVLPSITSCFGSGKSVVDSLEALKKEQQSGDPAGKIHGVSLFLVWKLNLENDGICHFDHTGRRKIYC